MIGLELLENAAIAVSLDHAGRILARAESEAATSLESAALSALEKLAGPRRPAALLRHLTLSRPDRFRQ